jgi:tetratricopeptide (TPR) repeat protein
LYAYAEDTGARLTDIWATVWDLDVKAKGGLLYGRKYEVQAWTAEAYEESGKGYKAKAAFLPTAKLLAYPDLAPVKGLTTDKANFSVSDNARITFVGYSAFVRSDVSKDAIEEEKAALRAAAEAEKKRVRDQKAWYAKGEKFVEERNWSEAQTSFLEARKLGLDSTDLSYNLGLAYQMNKDYPSAISEYQKVLGANPRDTDVRYNLARIYEKQKSWDNAIKEYQAILKFDPDDASARERLELLKAARDMVQ